MSNFNACWRHLHDMGMHRVVPDLSFVLPDPQAAFVDIKAPDGGRLTHEQRFFLERCAEIGVRTAIINDFDQFVCDDESLERGSGVRRPLPNIDLTGPTIDVHGEFCKNIWNVHDF